MHHTKIRSIYKAILKLHRGLPADLKELGDGYVKDEFRRHVKGGATEGQTKVFLKEWNSYYSTLSAQVGGSPVLGQPIPAEKLEDFQDSQIYQLYDLKLATDPEVSKNTRK